MARNTPGAEEDVHTDGADNMKIERGYNREKVVQIAKDCGAKSVRDTVSYLDLAAYRSRDKFVCEILDDVAFFAGMMCKKHFRLYEMAVVETAQRKGYGRAMITRMRQLCQKSGASKITPRTSKEETAIQFYKKLGGKIVGEKENDYEVEFAI